VFRALGSAILGLRRTVDGDEAGDDGGGGGE
jgi:hypothetical protein